MVYVGQTSFVFKSVLEAHSKVLSHLQYKSLWGS